MTPKTEQDDDKLKNHQPVVTSTKHVCVSERFKLLHCTMLRLLWPLPLAASERLQLDCDCALCTVRDSLENETNPTTQQRQSSRKLVQFELPRTDPVAAASPLRRRAHRGGARETQCA